MLRKKEEEEFQCLVSISFIHSFTFFFSLCDSIKTKSGSSSQWYVFCLFFWWSRFFDIFCIIFCITYKWRCWWFKIIAKHFCFQKFFIFSGLFHMEIMLSMQCWAMTIICYSLLFSVFCLVQNFLSFSNKFWVCPMRILNMCVILRVKTKKKECRKRKNDYHYY